MHGPLEREEGAILCCGPLRADFTKLSGDRQPWIGHVGNLVIAQTSEFTALSEIEEFRSERAMGLGTSLSTLLESMSRG